MIVSEYPDPPPLDFEVLPENWLAVQVFEACATQLEYHAMNGQPLRMNYQCANVVIERRFPGLTSEQFEQFQILERVVINYVFQQLQSQS